MKEKVVVAMSGGVDSSVSAAMLVDKGYDVVGVSMQLWDYSEAEGERIATAGSCCSLDDLYDARRVADALNIPFYVMNMEAAFNKEVVDYFVKSYLSGETPNPCTKCNQELKFKTLLRKARELGAAKLATGHYARIVQAKDGSMRLLKAVDLDKDQSYFLFTMTQDELKSVLFPLGETTKAEARRYAERLGLRTAHKEESQEICFVTGGSYADFIGERTSLGATSGDIVDTAGNKLGTHLGLHRYTIGQRKGIGIGGEHGPYYVVRLDMKNNRLVVGADADLMSAGLVARDAHWVNSPPKENETLVAKARYRHAGVECSVSVDCGRGDRLRVRFSSRERAVTPGQAVVFYRGDEVVGGAWIESAAN
jgi:tRNA-specific 2-thiouridylase